MDEMEEQDEENCKQGATVKHRITIHPVTVCIYIAVIIVMSVWSWQMVGVKSQISGVRAELLEGCMDFECEVDWLGNLECMRRPFSFTPNVITFFNESINHDDGILYNSTGAMPGLPEDCPGGQDQADCRDQGVPGMRDNTL